MDPFGAKALGVASVFSAALAARAAKKRSLTTVGCAVGFAVGFLSLSTGLRGLLLFFFYQIGSWSTKYKHSVKAKLDGTVSTHSVRGAPQVLACSAVAVLLSLLHAYYCGRERQVSSFRRSPRGGDDAAAAAAAAAADDDDDTDSDPDFQNHALASRLYLGIVAHYATCLADTLASELGMLSPSIPVLIVRPWEAVPSGTNGAVSSLGTIWSFVGGALVGFCAVAVDSASGILDGRASYRTVLILYAGLCGLVGSLIDSVLGATVQATYWDEDAKLVRHENKADGDDATGRHRYKHISGYDILTNEQVNLVSVVITTALGGWCLGPWMFSQILPPAEEV